MSPSKRSLLITVVSLGLTLVVLASGSQILGQSGTTNFSVSPATQTVTAGNQVTVQVKMNPNGRSISNFQFRLQYPSAKLSSPQVNVGNVFTSQAVLNNTLGAGYVQVALGCNTPCVPYSGGQVTVATITFNSVSGSTGTADFSFNTNAAITYIYDNSPLTVNVLQGTTGGSVTFGGGTTTVPTTPPTSVPTQPANLASFFVSPATQTVTAGNQVTVQVKMNPNGRSISNFQFRLQYPIAKLSNPTVTLGSVFTSQTILANSVNTAGSGDAGYMQVALGCSAPCTSYSGSTVTVATIRFNTVSSVTGNASLTFDSNPVNTYIYDNSLTPVNILGSAVSGAIVFPGGTTVTPTQAPGAEVKLSTGVSQSVIPGNIVRQTITLDPDNKKISNLQFRLEFDPAVFLNPRVTSLGLFQNQVVLDQAIGSGFVQLALGCATPCVPFFGRVESVASIEFDSATNASGSKQINFNSNPLHTYTYDDSSIPVNVLQRTVGSTITFGSGGTVTPTVTPPVGAGFTFKMRFQGVTSDTADQQVKLTFRQGDATVLEKTITVSNKDVSPDDGQYYAVVPGLPAGTYDVLVKGPAHLVKKFTGVTVAADGSGNVNWADSDSEWLLVGDVNNDNKLTVEDFALIRSKYTDFKVPVDPAAKSTDVNFDGFITIDDLALFLVNWNDLEVFGHQ